MDLLKIKGIGAKTVEKLGKLGIYTLYDMIDFLPRKYWDMTVLSDLDNTAPNEYVLLKGIITTVTKTQYIRRSMNLFKATLNCDGRKIILTFFNAPYLRDKLTAGEEYLVWGKITFNARSFAISNPSFEKAGENERLKGIVPIYPLKNMLPQQTFRKYVNQALAEIEYESVLELNAGCDEISLKAAYYSAHFPENSFDAVRARLRLDKEELICQLIAYKYNKTGESYPKKHYDKDAGVIDCIIKELPYELSPSQKKAVNEIIDDMKSQNKTNRLLSGDVGSGKTIVALLSAAYAVKCGYQVAIMAPTEILAKQHYNTAKKVFSNNGIRVELLTGESGAADRRRITSDCALGNIDILIGTHAIISDKINFADLGYIVIDELQRFGVRHKSALENKSKYVDLLVMSATPIPRAMALTALGDLSLSTLESRGDMGNHTLTKIVRDNELDDMYDFIHKICDKGEQAYIVCPLVEDSEGIERISVKKLFASLVSDKLIGVSVGLVYSGMKENLKNKVMQDFYDGKISVLVATTVIEVGIDSPKASVMAVLNADSFGLATLHQLRGRVGRREGLNSYCFLHTSIEGECERLSALRDNTSGFQVAEIDAKMRGLGDFLGVKQSGMGNTFSKMDAAFVAQCREIADYIFKNKLDIALEYESIKKHLDNTKKISMS